MNGLGTIVNVLAIVVAGGIGTMFRGKLRVRYQEILLQAVGLFVILLGAHGLWTGLFDPAGKQLETTGTLLVVFSLLIGGVFGEAFRIDRGIDRLGNFFRRLAEKESDEEKGRIGQAKSKGKTTSPASAVDRKAAIKSAKAAATGKPVAAMSASKGNQKEAVVATDGTASKRKRRKLSEMPTHDLPHPRSGHLFVDGFALTTMVCALNSLAFTGAIADGMHGNPKELFIKAIIDAVPVFLLSTVYGSGAPFAAVSVLVVEGLMTVVAGFAGEYLTATLISHLVIIASTITLGAGICLCFGKRWRVINLVPAFLISPIYGLVMLLMEKVVEK